MRSAAALLAIQQLDSLGESGAVQHALLTDVLDPYLDEQRASLAGHLAEADAEIERCEAAGVRVRSIFDEDFPARQRTSHDKSPVLYIRGNEELLRREGVVAIGGANDPDAAALEAVDQIVAGVKEAGWALTAVIGPGVEGGALEAAVAAGVPTIGVLPCGFEGLPFEHYDLSAAIIESGGTLVGVARAYLPTTAPGRRNSGRVASTQAILLILVGGAKKSPAMSLALGAALQGRPVFCTPPPPGEDVEYDGTRAFLQKPAGSLPDEGIPVFRNRRYIAGRELGEERFARPIDPGRAKEFVATLEAQLDVERADPPKARWWLRPPARPENDAKTQRSHVS